MSDDTKRRGPGRPPKSGTAATETLGRVRVTPEQLEAYTAAAQNADESLSDWARGTLDRAARRRLARRSAADEPQETPG